jgi:hypothetical protein
MKTRHRNDEEIFGFADFRGNAWVFPHVIALRGV